jgi:hypothetical protein
MKHLTIISLVWLFTANLSAQEVESSDENKENTTTKEVKWYYDKDKNHHARFTIAIQPTQLITHQNFRFDSELRLGKSRNWLQLGINFPFDSEVIWEDNYYSWGTSMKDAFGLNFNYKYFPSRYFYVAGGPSWRFYDIKYHGYQWFKFKEDGLEYHEYRDGAFNQKINNVGLNAMCGFQKISRHGFLFDTYLGAGYQKAFYSDPDLRKFDSTAYSRGYSGWVFLIGIRIGGAIKVGSYL